MEAERCEVKVCWELLLGNFCQTFAARLLWGKGRGSSSSRAHPEDLSPPKSLRVLRSSDMQHFLVEAGGRRVPFITT